MTEDFDTELDGTDVELEETVKFRYSAASNYSFRGEVDSGVFRSDWDEMTDAEQQQVYTEVIFGLVDLWDV